MQKSLMKKKPELSPTDSIRDILNMDSIEKYSNPYNSYKKTVREKNDNTFKEIYDKFEVKLIKANK
jgi:hypothetical protein